MTLAMLTRMLCLASGVFGRPAWDDARCEEHAAYIMEAAEEYSLDPVHMVSLEIVECDMQDKDNPVKKLVRGREVVVGFDACPMGVRIMGVEKRAGYDARALYQLAAKRMARWKKWCARKHKGSHHFLAHYNEGNPLYVDQVLGVAATLRARPSANYHLSDRISEIVRRLSKIFVRGWWSPNS